MRCVKKGHVLRRSKGRTLQLTASRDEKLVACVVCAIDFFLLK